MNWNSIYFRKKIAKNKIPSRATTSFEFGPRFTRVSFKWLRRGQISILDLFSIRRHDLKKRKKPELVTSQ
jgi:hypothetical protein